MLSKLTITRCDFSDGKVSPGSKQFKAAINPADIKQTDSISYTDKCGSHSSATGKAGVSPKFEKINAQKLNFSITLDGTGVVEASGDDSVSDQVNQLGSVVYDYQGKNHEPSIVEITWGSEMAPFFGRLTRLDIDYTLFRSSGEPLRAKVSLGFTNFGTNKEEAMAAMSKSPDLTHIVRMVSCTNTQE